MEALQVHSQSFLVKWVSAPERSVIQWQIKPLKKSINVGLFRRSREYEIVGADIKIQDGDDIEDRLAKSGLTKITWHGKCSPDELLQASHHVPAGLGGMYAVVFDNSFSKNTSKTVMFSHSVEDEASVQSTGSVSGSATGAVAADSDTTMIHDGRHVSGTLLKKRRKKMQGFARRYFTLDTKYGVLNYYLSQKSHALRGSMPMRICAISANRRTRDIVLDSGLEVWHTRALSDHDWSAWIKAFDGVKKEAGELAAIPTAATPTSAAILNSPSSNRPALSLETGSNDQEGTLLSEVSALVDQFSHTMVQANQLRPASDEDWNGSTTSLEDHPTSRRGSSFFRRRTSSSHGPGSSSGAGSTLAPSHGTLPGSLDRADFDSVLNQLNLLKLQFEDLVKTWSSRDVSSAHLTSPTRLSMDGSVFSDEFYDAMENIADVNYVISDEEDDDEEELDEDHEEDDNMANVIAARRISKQLSSSATFSSFDVKALSSVAKAAKTVAAGKAGVATGAAEPVVPPLYPLPHGMVKRRLSVPDAAEPPPSLLGILRKNVGKDMTTLSMPVTANDATTFLQRGAETMEASNLMDLAAHSQTEAERLIYVASFCVAALSPLRSKERCLRKPFVPLLGETYELVREDLGFRLVAEKIHHHPLHIVFEVEARDWTINSVMKPGQKFWGRSAELTDAGVIRVELHTTGEVFELGSVPLHLRNLIAGEKYIEPVGETLVTSSSGSYAQIKYKSAGAFSGRSEAVNIKVFDPNGIENTEFSAEGKWTESLTLVEQGTPRREPYWKPVPLVDQRKFGFTQFTCTLNEVTEMEDGMLPPTDSRLRPDLRTYESGDVKRADELKHELEEAQRARRKHREMTDEVWQPQYFEEMPGSNVWSLKKGADNYWARRRTGAWPNTRIW